ncbi:YdcF family protein [Vibrio sp. 99-70-13A1]|uniref:YdcF family protein n=1 Tax=Vibrio sp. 99-70-13A1 TaxID=2607601 RepID=UPI0014935125|nr:YdcF family protein [Vibrio sp. 99-70-13A1]NOH95683.1 YdcF family protein [Vibrio sp. 99-70-13A1]
MSTNHLLIVLGKRLNKNILTVEGQSRVHALHHFLLSRTSNPDVSRQCVEGVLPDEKCQFGESLIVAFCGGVTNGQTLSEAEVMYQYFREVESQSTTVHNIQKVLLEKESTNTVENIRNVVAELKKSGLQKGSTPLKVTFVSNDYHLQRIFEIQQLMDEQGLLKVFRDGCSAMGIELEISHQLEDHVVEPYPHRSLQGQLFLLMDALTTYRVYLEGVAAGAFHRDLSMVRHQPAKIALEALQVASALVNESKAFPLVNALLPVMRTCVESTDITSEITKVREYLALLDTNLTLLNRYLDPEVDHAARWWR